MSPHVILEMTSLSKGVLALHANKRPFFAVHQHVFLQISSTDARIAALVATVGLLPIMLEHVRFEVFGCLEGEMAQGTFVLALNFHGILFEQSVLL